MRIIISPAKKMNRDSDTLEGTGRPVFLKKTERILEWMRRQDAKELRNLWKCNEKIADQNMERIRNMDLERNLTPAILAYEGIQYQYMAPAVFEEGMLRYIQEHLRILSGFYGVLKPMDGVVPYRLEMQAGAEIDGCPDLYAYWGDTIYREVVGEDRVIVNLASKEYSKCVEKYLCPEDTFVTCIFGELLKDKVVQKGTYAKMARGEMVRYMAENQIREPAGVKAFDRMDYRFCEEHSSEKEFVFIRRKNKDEE